MKRPIFVFAQDLKRGDVIYYVTSTLEGKIFVQRDYTVTVKSKERDDYGKLLFTFKDGTQTKFIEGQYVRLLSAP